MGTVLERLEKTVGISVIVPIYNAERYLKECLDSILRQTFSDFECILVDDGSTDSSAEICKKYADADKRFKYYRKPNGGGVPKPDIRIGAVLRRIFYVLRCR